MSLSNPINPPLVNEAVAKPVSTGLVFGVDENQTKVNQLHGIAANNALGAGIPKQVSNVQVSIANASQGSTCTIYVLFKADPSDSSLSGVNIWVKGYQGNSNPVLIGSGTTSPTNIVLNNTGETVTFIVQAFGNGGNSPIGQSPTCSGTLPKSATGGFGSSAVASNAVKNGSVGQIAVIASGITQVQGSDLTGDVTTSGGVVTTVKQIQGVAVATSTPLDGDGLRYEVSDAKYDIRLIPDWVIIPGRAGAVGPVSGTLFPFQTSDFVNGTSGTGALDNANAELSGTKYTTSVSATSIEGFLCNQSTNPSCYIGIIRRVRFRLKLAQTTNCRMWFGMSTGSSAVGALYESDIPNVAIIGFRFSTAAGDTAWQGITQVAGGIAGSQTKVNTAIAPDTNTHVFDMVYDGTKVTFYIDGVSVGSSALTIPTGTTGLGPFVVIDNVGTANAQAFTFYYAKGTLVNL